MLHSGGRVLDDIKEIRLDTALSTLLKMDNIPTASAFTKYRPPLHKGTKCDMRFKSSLNSARLNLLNPYK